MSSCYHSMTRHASLLNRAACLCLLLFLLTACALGSPTDSHTPTPPHTPAPDSTATSIPTPEPSPTPSIPTVGLVGRFATAPAGSVSVLTFDGMQTAAASNSALWILDSIDIDALDSADPAAALRMAAGRGDAIIIAAGAGLADATRNAALEYPDIAFIGVDQSEENAPPNLHVLGGAGNRMDQEGFLAGALAGYVSSTGIVGAVVEGGALDGKKYANGYLHGLRYSCGDCQLFVIELENTTDLEAGAGTAARLQNVNADVMFAAAGEAGEAALEAAAARGMWIVGVGRDYAITLPDVRALPSLLRRPDLSLLPLLTSLLAGNNPATPFPFSLENGNITLSANYTAEVSPAVIRLMDDLIPRLASGELDTGVDLVTGEVK